MVRHCDQDEREKDGAMYWQGAILPILNRKLPETIGKNVQTRIGSTTFIVEVMNKTRFEICEDSEDEVVYI